MSEPTPLRMLKTASPLSEEELDRAEAKVGHEFPAAYRAFLLEHNGGRPSRQVFRFTDEIDEKDNSDMVEFFLYLQPTGHENFFEYNQIFQSRIPLDLLVIARTPGNDLVCLATKGSHKGKVFVWVRKHENEDDPWSPAFELAERFDAFLASLIDLQTYLKEAREKRK
ncbi:SMI1/KNR4 family protein [Sulfidibacter corallicola]|uniref:SMI1/KNR4 family protein n=1 Tax=Sulfidibacter corallicola TaxID=2818388 RepID=A0A8A4TP49_SULCO|nr:SMI1/KNR4 family protein [Sulfidibacter corallicola]QTD48365.1 SMI1/KNR4 family protein [Sulfidibacter corallicola]